jgi:SAM-dependent methyltransferase
VTADLQSTLGFRPAECAICGPGAAARVRYASNVVPSDLTADVFSARRVPDRLHYRLVECATCGLVRSDPVLDSDSLSQLYANSTFDYASEVGGLSATYGRYLAKVIALGGPQRSILEIGCGNGFFLDEALDLDYERVAGVEPSFAAMESASPRVRAQIRNEIMRPGLFRDDEFDAICVFQTLDHLPDPAMVLGACRSALRPGGLLLILNHNIEAISARLLGEKSPIIDVEHTYLYSPKTLALLLAKNGFDIADQGRVFNSISLRYLSQLLPISRGAKRRLTGLLDATRTARINIRVPLGNLYAIARKPA